MIRCGWPDGGTTIRTKRYKKCLRCFLIWEKATDLQQVEFFYVYLKPCLSFGSANCSRKLCVNFLSSASTKVVTWLWMLTLPVLMVTISCYHFSDIYIASGLCKAHDICINGHLYIPLSLGGTYIFTIFQGRIQGYYIMCSRPHS